MRKEEAPCNRRGVNVEVGEGDETAVVWGSSGSRTCPLFGTVPRRTKVGHGREQLGQKAGPGGLGATRAESVACCSQKGDLCGQRKIQILPPLCICAQAGVGNKGFLWGDERVSIEVFLVFLQYGGADVVSARPEFGCFAGGCIELD